MQEGFDNSKKEKTQDELLDDLSKALLEKSATESSIDDILINQSDDQTRDGHHINESVTSLAFENHKIELLKNQEQDILKAKLKLSDNNTHE